MSEALAYHRATNVAAHRTDEDETRTLETYPTLFKDYGDSERVPLEESLAGPILGKGAAVMRTRTHFGPPGKRTVHFRGYSSAGALYPIEAYVAASDALYSFDALTPGLVRVGEGDVWSAVAAAVGVRRDTFVVLTGVHSRTGWKYMERGYRHVWWDVGTMLANVLALAASDDHRPRLHVAFIDRELNAALGIDGVTEYALAVVALGDDTESSARPSGTRKTVAQAPVAARYPLAEAAHASSACTRLEDVRGWRTEPPGEEPKVDRDALVRAIRRRGSVRAYAPTPLPRDELADLLRWTEAPIPADAPSVVRQVVTVAAVEGVEPGIYDAQLSLIAPCDERELREAVGFAAMEQEPPEMPASTSSNCAISTRSLRGSATAATAGHCSKPASMPDGCRSVR